MDGKSENRLLGFHLRNIPEEVSVAIVNSQTGQYDE